MIDTSQTRRRGYKPGQKPWTAYLYILPGFLIYGAFVLWPIIDTLRYSFYDWDGFSTPTLIGLGNYLRLFQDSLVGIALRNNLLFIFFYTLFPIVIALFLTSLLTRRRMAYTAI